MNRLTNHGKLFDARRPAKFPHLSPRTLSPRTLSPRTLNSRARLCDGVEDIGME